MFDQNIREFILNVGLNNLGKFLESCGDFDTFNRVSGKPFNKGKQLCYNSNEVNVKHLRMIYKVSKGESLGDSFKGKLYQGRCEEFLENLNV